MKAILAFALLVIAAQAVTQATPAYFLGFTEQIGLNGEQMKHGSVCFDTVRKVLGDVHHLVQSKKEGLSEVLRAAIELVNDVEYKFKADCSVYMNDILSTFFRNYQGGDLKEVAKSNWRIYAPEIIQQIALYFDYVAARNDYEAGRTEAYIYQILLGLEKPKVLPVPVSDPSRRVNIDLLEGVINMTQSYYEALGLNDTKAIRDNVLCTLAQVEFNKGLVYAKFAFIQSHNVTEKKLMLEGLIHALVQLHDTCFDAFTFNYEHIIAPILGAFKVAPVHATLAVVHNIALNLPEIKQSFLQVKVSGDEGRADEIGKIYAQLLMTTFSNIYPRH